jgi:glycosyltransferase involved in cell wall biosynthesis
VIGAWRAGRVVVSVSSVGPAALIASEADGLLTPLGDPAALDAAIQRVGSDRSLVRRLIQGGRQRYEDDFSEEAVARRWKDLIRKLTP